LYGACQGVSIGRRIFFPSFVRSESPFLRPDPRLPIVFVFVGDPVGSGFVDSLARPGGNLTGFANFENSIGGKWLELLKEIAQEMARLKLRAR
jgi:putative ABC transport system substrate-binding protein